MGRAGEGSDLEAGVREGERVDAAAAVDPIRGVGAGSGYQGLGAEDELAAGRGVEGPLGPGGGGELEEGVGGGGGGAGPGGLLLVGREVEVRVGVRGGGGGFEAAAPDDAVEAVLERLGQGLGRGVGGVEARDADLGDDGVLVGGFG